MMRYVRVLPFALALLIAAGAQAASSTLTLTGTTTISISGSSISYGNTGTATFVITGGPTLSGTFTVAIPASALTGSTVTVPFTITVSAGNTLFGTYTEPTSLLFGGNTSSAGPASVTISGGTGSYQGYQGTFTNLQGSSSPSGSSGTTYTFTFTGSGTMSTSGGTTTAPPTISSVQDGASNTPNIAQGEFLSVYGTNLTPTSSGATDFPRPTSVGGVKVTFTPVAGGTGTDVYLIGVYKATGYDQINALLPSTVPVGSYNVTVTNGTVSSPFLTKVVASKPGLFTLDQSGTGLAVVFNYISPSESDVDRLTTGNYNGSLSSPAKPGQALVTWGTGIGPYQPGDNTAGITHDFSKSEAITAIVGGVSIPVDFAGLNLYAGEDQINFTLPANVPTGCSVTLQISVAGVLSAPTSISIAPAGATACVQTGYTTQQLVAFDQGGTITSGGFTLDHGVTTGPSSATADFVAGVFSQTTGFQLSSSSGTQSAILANSGGCIVTRVTTSSNTVTAGHSTSFDAGTVTLTGPSGTNLNKQQLAESSNTYLYMIGESGSGFPGQPSGSILAGTYTLTGAGGNDVGPFSTSITIGPPLTLNSPLPTTVTESAGLTLNWTGGNAPDVVQIVGDSVTTSGTGANQTTTATGFLCTTTAGQKAFTVPPSILTWLPTITAAQVAADTASGDLQVLSIATPATSFNATLKKDGSNIPSSFSSLTSISGSALYQ